MADGQQIPKLDIAPQVSALSLKKILLGGIVGPRVFPGEIGVPVYVSSVIRVSSCQKKRIHEDPVEEGNLDFAPPEAQNERGVGSPKEGPKETRLLLRVSRDPGPDSQGQIVGLAVKGIGDHQGQRLHFVCLANIPQDGLAPGWRRKKKENQDT
jgi:hypothetical protein